MEKAGIQTCSKASQGIGLSHTGSGGKHTNPPDILEIIQTVSHFGKVPGNEVVFFLQLLFVKRVEGKSVVGVIHQASPPAFE